MAQQFAGGKEANAHVWVKLPPLPPPTSPPPTSRTPPPTHLHSPGSLDGSQASCVRGSNGQAVAGRQWCGGRCVCAKTRGSGGGGRWGRGGRKGVVGAGMGRKVWKQEGGHTGVGAFMEEIQVSPCHLSVSSVPSNLPSCSTPPTTTSPPLLSAHPPTTHSTQMEGGRWQLQVAAAASWANPNSRSRHHALYYLLLWKFLKAAGKAKTH